MSYINFRGPRMKEWVQEAKHPEKPKRFELFLISTLQLFHTPSSKNVPCQWINSEGYDPAEHVFRGTWSSRTCHPKDMIQQNMSSVKSKSILVIQAPATFTPALERTADADTTVRTHREAVISGIADLRNMTTWCVGKLTSALTNGKQNRNHTKTTNKWGRSQC